MKRLLMLLITIGIGVYFGSMTSYADQFGPSEWHQYRMQSDKNAVFDNGCEPLEFKKFQTAEEIRSTPVVVGNKLFIGNHESGDIFAFNINTGEELWHKQVPNWVHSEMIYHDGKIYVGVGNRFVQEDTGIRGTEESGVFAFNAETGDELWKYNTDGEVMPTPVYYEGSIYAVTGDMHLYKLDAETGEELHKEEIGSWVSMSAPVIENDTLFFGGGGNLPFQFSAYDLKTDEFKWQKEFPDVYAGLDDVPPAVHNNIVITTALEKDGEHPEHIMYAMDTQNGELLWEESLGVGEMVRNNKSGAPMIYEDKVFVGSPITKTFYAYELSTGEKIWDFENEIMKAPPVAKDDIVYFSNVKGVVYALDTDSGELLGEVELGGTLAPAGPIIVNNTMFIGSQDTNVYAVPLTKFVEEQDANKASAEGLDESKGSERQEAAGESKNSISYGKYVIIGVLSLALLIILFLAIKGRARR